METLLIIYVMGGVLLAVLSLPLIARKVRPNPFYGFRVQATLKNPDLWYVTNRFFAQRQLAVALIEVAAAIALYFIPDISIEIYALSVLGVFVIAFVIAVFQSWRYLKLIR